MHSDPLHVHLSVQQISFPHFFLHASRYWFDICRIIPRHQRDDTNIRPRAFRPEGWYWSRVIRHVIRILPCFIRFIIYFNRRVISYELFTGLPSVLLLSCFKSLKRTAQLLIQSTSVTLQFACCCFKNILFIIAFFCVFWIFYSCVQLVCQKIWKLDVRDVTCIYQTMTSFNKLRHTRMTAPILRTFFS